MTQAGPMPNGKTYSDETGGPNSLTGPLGYGYTDHFIELLGQVLVVAGNALSSAGSALSSATAAADSLTATNEAASDAQDSADAAEAALQDALDAVAAAEAFDPANYPRSDSGQTVTVLAAWTFEEDIALDGADIVRNSIVQTRITKRVIVATGSSSITFPASPANMDRAIFYFNGDYQSSPAVIGRNGSNVNGVAEDLTVDNINGVEVVEFEYYQAASSWGVV